MSSMIIGEAYTQDMSPDAVLARNLLVSVGVSLYGTIWQRELASAMDVDEQEVRDWLLGRLAISPSTLDELRQVCLNRIDQLQSIVSKFPPTSR